MSAYHQVKEGAAYPAALLIAALDDPRFAPWQPGKMAARLQAATSSGKPVLLRLEDPAASAGNARRQQEEELADVYAFLLWQFGHPDFQPPPPPPPPIPSEEFVGPPELPAKGT
jgi:prolyl oligopeptidase